MSVREHDLWERANGIDRTRVEPDAAARSVAAECFFPRDEPDPERHRRALLSLTEELGARLRVEGQVCRSLAVSVRYADRTAYPTPNRSRTLREPTAHSASLTELAYRIAGLVRTAEGAGAGDRAAGGEASRRRTGVPSAHLRPGGRTGAQDEAVSGRLRARFGPQAVKPGRLAG